MAGVGPILLFDKSTLQSLSVDESVWFDTFYYPTITPLFFVETLADLEKEVGEGRTPEQVVGNLAEKTPTGGHPNVYHETLRLNELLGQPVAMRHVPIVAGGESFVSGKRRGIVIEQPPEVAALQRWEEADFMEVERAFARAWRQALSGLDLEAVYRQGRAVIERLGRPRDLAEAKAMAVALLDKRASRSTREAFETLPVPDGVRRAILGRWNQQGSPPISEFAPYAAHVLTVDLFFCIGLGADLISRQRASNKVDIAYLYYLPFCMAFTSNDNLHARTAPLFLDEDQVFIRGQDLKADLARLDAYYSALPEDVKREGVMSFAHYPPTDGDFITSALWDKLMAPGWRDHAKRPRKPLPREAEKKLVDEIRQMADAPRAARGAMDFDSEEADAVVIQRKVPVRRGKWRLLPPGVETEESGQ